MKTADLAIVTMTLARTSTEERVLLRSLEKLFAFGLPLIIADGGSRKSFVRRLLNISSSMASPEEKGLVQQVKAALATALHQFPEKPFLLYTEPDKYPFFEGRLTEFVARVTKSPTLGVAIAARDERSFRTFPEGQQWSESFMNGVAELSLGLKTDYCYGPLLLSRRTAEMALDAPNELGWGWRFHVMARAKEAGLQLKPESMHLPCPKEQRGENTRADRLYRVKQLRQNLAALALVFGE